MSATLLRERCWATMGSGSTLVMISSCDEEINSYVEYSTSGRNQVISGAPSRKGKADRRLAFQENE